MNYHDIKHDDMTNGDGIRVTLFVSGCSHHCPECQNPQTHNEESGIPFDEKAKNEIFNELSKDYISGITFSGGDPLFIGNRVDITSLAKEIKEKYPDKTIWLYTGYKYEDIKNIPVMKYIDILVDGRYEKDKRDINLKWRGSSNQRVIDIKKSIEEERIILHCDDADSSLDDYESKECGCGC